MPKPIVTFNTPEQEGLVISYFGNSVAVEANDGQVFQCQLHRNQALPVVGDKVAWQLGNGETGTVIKILPRRTLLSRGNGHGKMKPIAANLDAMVVVMAPPPVFSEYLIDRYLVAAQLLNIEPILVLNKTDLITAENRELALARFTPYVQIPYAAIMSSVLTQTGLTEISHYLRGKTAVLVGPSGVGKSSIISALSSEYIRINQVSAKGTGKHTTTATRLYHLPQNGKLIDSPGVREFNLWPITKQEVLLGFKEFQPFLQGCRFRDCEHLVEPGCLVQAAVADGKISASRFASYQALMKEARKAHTR